MIYALVIILLITVGVVVYLWFDCPYSFPKFEHVFRCHSWESYDFDDLLDDYFSKEGQSAVKDYVSLVSYWKAVCEERIKKSVWRKHRRKQYESLLAKNELSFSFDYRINGVSQETCVFDARSLCSLYPDLQSILGRGSSL